MAVEARRGCGYRKVGGLYFVAPPGGFECVMLPYPLEVCPTCGEGIKPSLGFKWIYPLRLFDETMDRCPNLKEHTKEEEIWWTCKEEFPTPHRERILQRSCPLTFQEKHGMMWVGTKFYSPISFAEEAATLGVSKRISHIPKEFIVGQTWIFLGHRQAVHTTEKDLATLDGEKEAWKPGIFMAFMPTKIEIIITQSQSESSEFMEGITKRGLSPVVVPDTDLDHRGSVYKKGGPDEAKEKDGL